MNVIRCRHIAISLAAASMAAVALAQQAASTQPASSRPTSAASKPSRWEAAVAAFETHDRKNTPPRDATLFIGSSSIVGWSTAASFPDFTVLNRGFGGSAMSDLVEFYERIVPRYRPRAIVVYAGDNDIAGGKPPEQVCSDFRALVTKIRRDLPTTPVVCLSIKPSRSRWEHWPAMQAANKLLEAECRAGSGLRFVDVGAVLLDETGRPRDELYLPDQLHLSPRGYEEWSRLLAPILRELTAR